MKKIFVLSLLLIVLSSCQSDYKLNIINKNLVKGDISNMVLVEAGEAIIGDDTWFEKGHKKKIVNIPSFYIDKYEVSNRDYNACVQEKVCDIPIYNGMREVNKPMQPIVGISFDDALKFCKWLGKRLPTENEWEKAARGPKGNIFPWGNEKLDCSKAVYGRAWTNECLKDKKFKYSVNVDSHPEFKSYYGAYHMVGNVWEWVDSEYKVEYFNKPKTANVTYKAVKGGSYGSSSKYLFAYSRRWERDYQETVGTGFRCARDINP